MNLIIYVKDECEDIRALFDREEGNCLLYGDYYHDKIDERIEGYLQALKDFDIYHEEVDTEWIEKGHPDYEKVYFHES